MKLKLVIPIILCVIISSCSSDDDPAPNNQASNVITPNTIAGQVMGKWRLDSVRRYNFTIDLSDTSLYGPDYKYIGTTIELTSNLATSSSICTSNSYVIIYRVKDNGVFSAPVQTYWNVLDANCNGASIVPAAYRYLLNMNANCVYAIAGYIETVTSSNLTYVYDMSAPALFPQFSSGYRAYWTKIP
jgi:hypothetical protein